MRIKINFYSEKKQRLDLNYYYYLSSLIYRHLQSSNSDFSSMLHDKGYVLHNKSFKLFTFSQLFPGSFHRDGRYMILNGNVTWYISSPVKEFILYFAESITSAGAVKIDGCTLEISDVSVLKPPQYSRQMSFKALSPIVVTTCENIDGEMKPRTVKIEDSRFVENIKNNVLRKYFILNNTLPDDMSFNISFKDVDKYSKGKLINFKGTFIKGYQAPFEFEGNPELIKVACEAGLGEKNASGMGFIEVV